MRVTQGTFSFLPDLTDDQIRRQIGHALGNGWALSVEHTGDVHPRNTYWEMWGPPRFDVQSEREVLEAIAACRAAHPDHHVKLNAFDSTPGWESVRLSFIVHRPAAAPDLVLTRQEGAGRNQRYAIRRGPR
jgi:ribulose-bisphosphate carboxylase small chain